MLKKGSKIPSLKSLHKKAWKIFSKWIRKRDKCTCFTCGVKKPMAQMQAGHFMHASQDFDPRNIHCQCIRCNHYLSGNLAVYTQKMGKKYGLKVVEELIAGRKKVHKYTREELEEVIRKYGKA
jgi:hypothetical protein